MGAVLLSGDVARFRENYDHNRVPRWNSDRSQTLVSLERFKRIARSLRATVIIQVLRVKASTTAQIR